MSLYSDIEECKSLDVKDGFGKGICEIFECKNRPMFNRVDNPNCPECLVKISYRFTLDPDHSIQIRLRSRPTFYEGDLLPPAKNEKKEILKNG